MKRIDKILEYIAESTKKISKEALLGGERDYGCGNC